MTVKPLLPSLREKKRYVAFEVQAAHAIEFALAKKSVEESLQGFLGTLGMAKAGVLFLNDWKKNRGIMKVNTQYVNEVKAALALVQEIAGEKEIIRSVGVSGSLEKIRSLYF